MFMVVLGIIAVIAVAIYQAIRVDREIRLGK